MRCIYCDRKIWGGLGIGPEGFPNIYSTYSLWINLLHRSNWSEWQKQTTRPNWAV